MRPCRSPPSPLGTDVSHISYILVEILHPELKLSHCFLALVTDADFAYKPRVEISLGDMVFLHSVNLGKSQSKLW